MADFGIGESAAAVTAATAAETAAAAGTATAAGATAAAGTAAASTAALTAGEASLLASAGAASAAALPAAGLTSAQLLAYGGLASTALSGGVSALGAINSADAAKKNADYQAQVQKNNQALAGDGASQAAGAGAANEERAGLQRRAVGSAIETSQAANNIDVGSGSAKDVRDSQSALSDLDALTLRHNVAQQIYGYQIGATSAGSEATLLQQQASQAPTAGALTAGGSLLSSAGSATNQYFSWMKDAGNSGVTAKWLGS